MSLPFNYLYEFGDFCLDPREKTLTRAGDTPVELTPKGFELLCVFVENHGRLLGKDELMDKIWADSFVEESNLTFNIRQLRVILGDDAHEPKYIKTVRRHGYRFIAEVRQIAGETSPQTKITDAPADLSRQTEPEEKPTAPQIKRSRLRSLLIPALFLFIALGVGAWFAQNLFRQSGAVLSAPYVAEKLSTNGKSSFAALSPDGKNLVYTNRTPVETEGIWLRRIETDENIELIPAAEAAHYDLEFSPDGTLI
jgi:DNA-binding winged helix-turn-helix (wHTH) protein